MRMWGTGAAAETSWLWGNEEWAPMEDSSTTETPAPAPGRINNWCLLYIYIEWSFYNNINMLDKRLSLRFFISWNLKPDYFSQNQPCICSGQGLAMSSLYPEMRFSWEIKSVDALFCNGLTRLNDLSKEAILQAIKDADLRFLQVKRDFSSSAARNLMELWDSFIIFM